MENGWEHYCFLIMWRDNDVVDSGGSRGDDEEWTDSGYVWKEEMTLFAMIRQGC